STDTGQPLAGTMQITATADGYTGSFTSQGLPAPLKVQSVTTAGRQLMATIDNGSNGLLLVWLEFAADGTFKGTYHQLSPGISASGKKEK
ncbi:MAG TPA: hypothetical protein VMM93_07345, partial [Vicinamibacterales bacterium]|nr:hypothetical protein [Vicinamibacterales bacterium]